MDRWPVEVNVESNIRKRLPYVNVAHSEMVLGNFAAEIREYSGLMASDTTKMTERRYSALADAYEGSALLSYAIGKPLEEVRDLIVQSVSAYERVLGLRGTDPPIPGVVVTLDPKYPWHDPRHVNTEPMHPPGFRDSGLGYSRRTYRATCFAFIAGERDAGRRLARQIWDQPDAPYLGNHKYAVCTKNDQRLAYAMREFFAANEEDAVKLVAMIGPTRGEPNDVVDEAAIWKAVLNKSETAFRNGLENLLSWHKQKTASEPNWKLEYFISVEGLGLSAIALERGVIQKEALPKDNQFLPTGLLR
jgi:hypothetical protein